MYLTDRRRDTSRDYISPAQSSRAKSPVNSIQLDGRQSGQKLLSLKSPDGRQLHARPVRNQRSLVKENLLVEDDIGEDAARSQLSHGETA